MNQAVRKGITLLFSLCMAMCFATVAMAEGEGTVYVAWIGEKGYTTLEEAVNKAQNGDTITLGENTYTLYGQNAETSGKDLTFVGKGADKTTWRIGPDNPGDGNSDGCFKGATKITFQNMKLQSGNANYLGFIHVAEFVVKDCVIDGFTTYWGEQSTNFNNTTFNAPNGQYALWAYNSVMEFDSCTFNTSGKVVNVYNEGGAKNVTVNFKDCLVNSSAYKKAVMNINDSLVDSITVNFIGDNKIVDVDKDENNKIKVDGIQNNKPENKRTCSRFYELNCEHGGPSVGTKTTVTMDGTAIWKDGKLVSHEYTAGHRDNAFSKVDYTKWTEQADGTVTRTRTADCDYCGFKEVTQEVCKHDDSKTVGDVAATCTEKGYSGNSVCNVCGTVTYGHEIDIDPNNHDLSKVEAKTATCTENGIVEHWNCAACHKNFSDDKATTEIPDVTDKAPGHDLKLVEAVKATTESEGRRAYYVCNRCGRWFWDSKGENPVESQEAIVTAKLTETTKDLQDKGTSITVENKAEGTVKETVSDQKAAQQAANSAVVENKDSLVDNVAKVAQAISNDETVKAAAKVELEKNGADLTNNKMELVVKPYPVVTITDDTDGVLSLEIALFRSVEAVAGDVRVPLPEETKKIDNEDITQPTTISMVIPEAYQGAKYIRHTLSNGRVKYYPVTTQDNVITFEVPAEDGFSPFVLIAEDATVTVKLDNETKTYNRTDVVNETALPTLSKNNYNFKGWKFEGIDGQHFNMTAELFEALLANHADTTVVNAVSVFEGPLSEHPEIEEAKKNGTWGVDENKPAATAKPAAAAAVTPVRSSIPKTSDDSNLMLWVCLMGLAALGLGGAVYMKKRNHQ